MKVGSRCLGQYKVPAWLADQNLSRRLRLHTQDSYGIGLQAARRSDRGYRIGDRSERQPTGEFCSWPQRGILVRSLS